MQLKTGIMASAPHTPSAKSSDSEESKKILTLDELEKHIENSNQQIAIVDVQSDCKISPNDNTGPWPFTDSQKTVIQYRYSSDNNVKSIT